MRDDDDDQPIGRANAYGQKKRRLIPGIWEGVVTEGRAANFSPVGPILPRVKTRSGGRSLAASNAASSSSVAPARRQTRSATAWRARPIRPNSRRNEPSGHERTSQFAACPRRSIHLGGLWRHEQLRRSFGKRLECGGTMEPARALDGERSTESLCAALVRHGHFALPADRFRRSPQMMRHGRGRAPGPLSPSATESRHRTRRRPSPCPRA